MKIAKFAPYLVDTYGNKGAKRHNSEVTRQYIILKVYAE
jgi:hypothetical protein